MKKVFIIEDAELQQELYAQALAGKVTIVAARTLAAAKEAWQEHPDSDLIVVDGCLHDHIPDTPPLVRLIRQTYTGPMIAASRSKSFRRELLAAGCSHEAPSKDEVPALVLQLLEIG